MRLRTAAPRTACSTPTSHVCYGELLPSHQIHNMHSICQKIKSCSPVLTVSLFHGVAHVIKGIDKIL